MDLTKFANMSAQAANAASAAETLNASLQAANAASATNSLNAGLQAAYAAASASDTLSASLQAAACSVSPASLGALSAFQDTYSNLWQRANEVSNLSLFPNTASEYLGKLSTLGIGTDIFGLSDAAFTRQKDLETKINGLTSKLRDKSKEIEQLEERDESKDKKISELSFQLKELEVIKLLSHLLPRVSERAQKKLCEDTSFSERFKLNSICKSVVVSIDIRDSTQLMLNAKSPELFAQFITSVSLKLAEIVTSNNGVYDKFTGDGLLCFFPDFYSGKDAIYYALKTAAEAHRLFQLEYGKYYKIFTVVRADIGLGIGIDFGDTCLTSISNDLTVVGIPVVYACRLSSAPANHTYLNQSAFEELEKNYTPHFSTTIRTHSFKNQGSMIAYDVEMNFEAIKPQTPDWI